MTSVIKEGPHFGRYITEFPMHRAGSARGGDLLKTRKLHHGFSMGVILSSLIFLWTVTAQADWNLYVGAGLGISTAIVDTDGSVSQGPEVPLFGADSDSSPLIEGAFGIEIPMDELVPREWLQDVRLPSWPVRFEIEASGLREFELDTDLAVNDAFFTELIATTTFVNAWVEIPMVAAYRPIQYIFGLGRQPRVRQWLSPASFYLGAGTGFSALEIDGTSNNVTGSDDIIDFAWNVGGGFNYQMSEKVDLSVGYRYVGLLDQEIDLRGGTPGPIDSLEFTPQIHELRVQVRVNVFEFLSPWR